MFFSLKLNFRHNIVFVIKSFSNFIENFFFFCFYSVIMVATRYIHQFSRLPRSYSVNKPGYLMLERAITADGREVLHILNIDNDNPVHDLEIKINGAGVLSEIISPDDPAPKYSIENNVIRLETLDTLVTLIFKK